MAGHMEVGPAKTRDRKTKTKRPAPILGAAEILGVQDRKIEEVPCPEWGGAVHLREMSGLERDGYELDLMTRNTNLRAALVFWCLCTPAGERLFLDPDTDIPALGAKNAAALDRLADKAQEMNGLRVADEEALKKKLEQILRGDSP